MVKLKKKGVSEKSLSPEDLEYTNSSSCKWGSQTSNKILFWDMYICDKSFFLIVMG